MYSKWQEIQVKISTWTHRTSSEMMEDTTLQHPCSLYIKVKLHVENEGLSRKILFYNQCSQSILQNYTIFLKLASYPTPLYLTKNVKLLSKVEDCVWPWPIKSEIIVSNVFLVIIIRPLVIQSSIKLNGSIRSISWPQIVGTNKSCCLWFDR